MVTLQPNPAMRSYIYEGILLAQNRTNPNNNDGGGGGGRRSSRRSAGGGPGSGYGMEAGGCLWDSPQFWEDVFCGEL